MPRGHRHRRACPSLALWKPEAVVWARRSPNARICSVFHTHRRNRPQTRQVWWWSFGVPTLASRHLQSAQDAGERAGMPPATHLLGFDNRNNLTRALRCLRRGGAARLRAMRHRVLEDARRASSVPSSARELQARELCIQYGRSEPQHCDAAMARGRVEEEWSMGRPLASASCGELDWACKPSRCLGGAATAARTPHRRRLYSSCMSSSARRLRRKGHGGTTFIRRRSTKRSSALSVLQGRNEKSS